MEGPKEACEEPPWELTGAVDIYLCCFGLIIKILNMELATLLPSSSPLLYCVSLFCFLALRVTWGTVKNDEQCWIKLNWVGSRDESNVFGFFVFLVCVSISFVGIVPLDKIYSWNEWIF